MTETNEMADASSLQVVRWKNFGQDRLYVNTADGRRVGWLNLTNDTRVVEIGRLREQFDRAIDEHLRALDRPEAPAPVAPARAQPPVPGTPDAPPDGPTKSPAPPRVSTQRAAGASAQAEYERRAARDREQRQAIRGRRTVALLASPFVGYALARAALLAYNRFAAETIASVGASTTEVEPVFDPSISHTYAIYGSIALTLLTIATLLQRKQTTEAFRIGAAGERKTAAILERLPAGWCALHDLPTRNGRGNIDHVAVGPAGLFTVETKNYTNGVVIKNGTARSAGRDLRKVVEQAKRQAKLVTDRTGVRATPIVVVHGKGVTVEGWFQKPVIDGVHFCSGHRLKKVLVSGRPSLSPTAVERLASDLDQ